MNWEVIWAPTLQLAVHLAGMAFVPLWSRKGLYFGVTVGSEFRQSGEAGRIYRTYLMLLLGISLPLAVALATSTSTRPYTSWAAILAFWIGFQWARRQVRPFQEAPVLEREVLLFNEDVREVRFWHWIPPLAPLLVAAAWIWLRWDQLTGVFFTRPAGLRGWERDYSLGWIVFAPICVMALMMNATLWYSALQARLARFITSSGASYESEKKRREALVQLYLGQSYVFNGIFALIGIGLADLIPFRLAAIAGAAAMLLSGTYWWRRSQQLARQRFHLEFHTDRMQDEDWKLGVYYFNKEDAALFVEDRSGIGFALNFANPIAWLLLAGFLLAPTLFLLLLWP